MDPAGNLSLQRRRNALVLASPLDLEPHSRQSAGFSTQIHRQHRRPEAMFSFCHGRYRDYLRAVSLMLTMSSWWRTRRYLLEAAGSAEDAAARIAASPLLYFRELRHHLLEVPMRDGSGRQSNPQQGKRRLPNARARTAGPQTRRHHWKNVNRADEHTAGCAPSRYCSPQAAALHLDRARCARGGLYRFT